MKIHGNYYEAEVRAWKNMRKRCTEDKFKPWYAGVTICDRWLNSYDAFVADVGRRPTPLHSLDRIDHKGNYEPNNVRWATKAVQSRNTKLHCTSKTGIRGVSWSSEKQKWRAAIYVNNKQKHVGYFVNINEAKEARIKAEELFWKDEK